MSIVENLKDVFLTVVYALIIAVVAPFVFWYFIMDDLKTILWMSLVDCMNYVGFGIFF